MSVILPRNVVSPGDDSSRRSAAAGLVLRRWPLAEEPQAAIIFATIVASLFLLTLLATANLVAALFVATALALAAWRTILPVTYVLDASGIEQRVFFLRRRIAWAAVARYEIWPQGVRLLRSAAGHPLDALRSVFIPWLGDREALLAHLSSRALRARAVDRSGGAAMPTTPRPTGTGASSIPSTSPPAVAAGAPPVDPTSAAP
jgi:hypothetical protein